MLVDVTPHEFENGLSPNDHGKGLSIIRARDVHAMIKSKVNGSLAELVRWL
jgi:hypothetical protein